MDNKPRSHFPGTEFDCQHDQKWHSCQRTVKLTHASVRRDANSLITLQVVVLQLEVFLDGRSASQVVPFHPSSTGRWSLIEQGVLTISNSLLTVLKTLVTVKRPPLTLTDFGQCPTPYVTLCRHITLKDDRITTLCTP